MQDVITVSLKFFQFNKKTKNLSIPSECFGGSFPRELAVRSHHTNKLINFKMMSYSHPKFDPDGWDGEQMLYVPVESGTNVETLAIYHQY